MRVYLRPGVPRRWRVASVSASMLAGALALPAAAQQAPAPAKPESILPSEQIEATPPPVTPTVPQAVVAPPQATQPLPTLSAAQAAQLARLLADGRVTQGLKYAPDKDSPSLDNDRLVRAALDYARAVHAGRLDTADFAQDWGLRPAPYDPTPGFVDAVKRDRLAQWIASLPPPYSGYDGLVKGLGAYRALEAMGGWAPLKPGPDLSLGAKGPRVVALRERLAAEDREVSRTGDSFDAALKEAVQRAQRRYGLNPTGTVSTQTLAALNVPVEGRIKQIMANLERWRWLPKELPKDRIQVNIAAAVLTVFEGDQPIMSMKGVTGKPGDGETPMLQSTIHSIVLNPPWNVPDGIAKRELFPKGEAYLKANGFRVIETPGGGKRLQQRSEQSALGKYKFDFDNPYAVYLHDTPSQATFSRFDRLASHGCIRLEKPAALAELLLRNDPSWGTPEIQAAVATGKTQRVKLNQQVAVFLLYWTAFSSANGAMNFRADPYEWDGELAQKIDKRSALQATIAN